MKYYTQINGEEFVIDIDNDGGLTVNDEPISVDFRQMPDSGVVSLLLNNRSLEAVVDQHDGGWDILINGDLYEVDVVDERAYRLAQARGTAIGASGDAVITSPMPGIVIAVPVAEGDEVSADDKVIILESMKMENELRTPSAGRVISVEVEPGASVEKGQVLVIISDQDDE